MKRSLNVPGSLSSALQTTYFSVPAAWRTNCHFDSVGKPAPPSPRSPEAFKIASAEFQSHDVTTFLTAAYRAPSTLAYGSEAHLAPRRTCPACGSSPPASAPPT